MSEAAQPSDPIQSTKPDQKGFTSYQKLVIGLLAFLQFTIILDFMIMSPLGALLMPKLKITPAQFGFVVSVYAFSAGTAGLLAAGFADRFDRKKLLLFFYTGFVVGTLLCGLATTYQFLVFARMVTGLFGGVIGSIILAITTDLFALEVRGRVMGVIQAALSASQVLGLPLGLYFSNLWGWHAPFFMIVIVSSIVGVGILFYLKPIDGHLKLQNLRHPFKSLLETAFRPRYCLAYFTTALLTTGGFMLMPFASSFNVNNLGLTLEQLPIVYMVTGGVSIFTGPYIGRLSDRFGKLRVFGIGSAISIAMVTTYTHLNFAPLWLVITISVVMFMGISSRMITSMALVSAVPEPSRRGTFMSLNSSTQQITGGISTAIAGLVVAEGADGRLSHYDILGFIVVGAMVVSIFLMITISRIVGRSYHKNPELI
ncbi:MAG: MFS transporter [Bacteriovoracia bacterium]